MKSKQLLSFLKFVLKHYLTKEAPRFSIPFYIYPCFIFFRYSEGLMPNSSLKHWRK